MANEKLGDEGKSLLMTLILETAGKFSPELRDGTLKHRYYARRSEIDVHIGVSLQTIFSDSEEQFRNRLAGIIRQGVEDFCEWAEKKKIDDLDTRQLRSKWADVLTAYLATPLPIEPPLKHQKRELPKGPELLIHYAYAPSEQAAQQLSSALQERGLRSELFQTELEEGEEAWLCTAYRQIRDDEDFSAEVDDVASIAKQFGCEYDGWDRGPDFPKRA